MFDTPIANDMKINVKQTYLTHSPDVIDVMGQRSSLMIRHIWRHFISISLNPIYSYRDQKFIFIGLFCLLWFYISTVFQLYHGGDIMYEM